jgi:hypothetical protein
MGLLSNTASLCQFRVIGTLPEQDPFQWVSARLAKNGFDATDAAPQEFTYGWVHIDDPGASRFDLPRAFWREHYIVFTLRRDQRRVPSALLRDQIDKAEKEFLAGRPGWKRVPKQNREEIREAVRASLLAQALPSPSMYDAVWDTRDNLVTFTSLSPKVIELFERHFKDTFDGLRLELLHPYTRADRILSDGFRPELRRANRSSTEEALDLVTDNQWIGWDFFLWLLNRTMTEVAEYAVSQPGPAGEGELFTAYLNDRLVLLGEAAGARQKVTVTGPQDQFDEVRAALQKGKQITEATLYMERDEETWKVTVKGERFDLASFKCPAVQIERDNLTDQLNEREAVFYERMFVLETGLQLFNSLFAAFLAERLGRNWAGQVKKIREWLTEE